VTPIEEGLEGGPSDPITSIGHSIMRTAEASGDALVLLARAIHHMPAALAKRSEILSQMLICGVYSLPVGMLVAAFTGMVLALQTGQALQEYRQGATIGALVAISMCRELGPIWVGVILAARVGSAMAAELGTMRVSEEIDALEVMSIDPAKFLVMPRIIALTLMAPVLTAFADAVGTLGGAIVG
jgi:phospholipid/cholesterol/gamma-HCH transport system permease protein